MIDEIHSYKDTPSEDIFDKFEEMLFAGHPLSNNILGTPGSVKKITREELLKFVREKFLPCRMAFTMVADIDEKKMEKSVLKMISKYFPDNSHGEADECVGCVASAGKQDAHVHEACPTVAECKAGAVACGNYGVPSADPFDKTLNKRNHQANCVIGGLAPSLYQERERIATVLMCSILGGPANNSILNSVLREKNGWVYSVECGYVQFTDTGMVTISLGCDKGNLEKCIAAVYREIKKLQEGPLSERKLKAAKKQLLGQLAISSDNGETQCLSMGKGLLAYGKVSTGKDNRTLVEAVTAEEIREMALKVFDFSKLSKLIYV